MIHLFKKIFNTKRKNVITIFLSCSLILISTKVICQANPTIAVLPTNSGIVAVGATLDLTITVGNTLAGSIPISKLRPVITVPSSVTFLPDAQQTGLPLGFTILTNSGSQLRFCNSGFVIPGTTNTIITLKVRGVFVQAANTFSGNINFGNGTTCAAGTSVAGDITADNTASSTIEVIAAALPVTLINFSANLKNCIPSLNWNTEQEVNSDKFIIERSNNSATNWATVGIVNAQVFSSTVSKYNFTDNDQTIVSKKVFYRLKIIDKDGTFKYSDILPVSIKCESQELSVFPNPVRNGKLYISLTGSRENTEANLLSVSGQIIMKFILKNGTNSVDVSKLTNGIYILSTNEANGINEKVKVIVQR